MVRAVVQLLLLLLAVPAQYLISLWLNPNPSGNSVEVLRLVDKTQIFIKKWIDPTTWFAEISKLCDRLFTDNGECIAVEVWKYRNKLGYFALSTEPRIERPETVKYRVGQVFKHKTLNYHGVIIGWDEQAKQKNALPHYAVLYDTSQSPSAEDYLNQNEIEIVSNTRVTNKSIEDYFESFDGSLYLPRQFLKELYPRD